MVMNDGKRGNSDIENNERGNKRKQKNENSNVSTRSTRSKFTFNPTNTLNTNSTPLKAIRNAENANPNEAKDPSPRLILRNDTISSDDHIFWAQTPKTFKAKDLNSSTKKNPITFIPSSPIDQDLKIIEPVSTLTKKYDSMKFENLINSNDKNQSSGSSKKLNHPFQPTPNMIPTKSTNSNNITPLLRKSVASTINPNKKIDLKALMNKIENEFNGSSFNDTQPSEEASSPINVRQPVQDTNLKPKAENNNAISDEIIKNESSDFDDFSEDFLDDLDKVIAVKKENILRVDTPITEISNQLKNENIDSEDSDFSDFDDNELDAILVKSSNPKPSLSVKVEEKTVTTQEQRIINADNEGNKVFKNEFQNESESNFEVFNQKKPENLANCAVQRDGIKRFQIVEIINSSYFITKNNNKIQKKQKILVVRDFSDTSYKIIVRDIWETLDLQVNDVIHIICYETDNFKLIDSNSNNLLIWNPDLLLSATLVGDTVNCLRRPVLKQKFEFRGGEYSMPLIVGEIVHSLFQSCLRESNQSFEFLNQVLEEQLELNKLNIFMMNETKESVNSEVQQHLPYIQQWFENYVKEKPLNSSKNSIRISGEKNSMLFSTSNVLDIEENIWSPAYGLRGLIDVTIESNLFEKINRPIGKFITPMEIKSGRSAQIAHNAQASLYTLLLKDRYEVDVNFFMLVYTKLKETTRYNINKQDLKFLILMRNKLSSYLKQGLRVLPELKKDSTCDSCYLLNSCMALNKLVENGDEINSGLKNNVYNELTGHLDENLMKYSEFYNYWDDLITKEESIINLLKNDLFLIDSETREQTTFNCLSKMRIKNMEIEDKENDLIENKQFSYTFIKGNDSTFPSSLLLHVYDRVIISDEKGHYYLCGGFINKITSNSVTILTDRRLKNNNIQLENFNNKNNQTIQSVLKPMKNNTISGEILYRIDRDEGFYGMKLARFNLLNLFLDDGDHKRRKLIVDNQEPKFDTNNELLEKFNKSYVPNSKLNEIQINAIRKVLTCQDYTLILGMPGTGKTTVIAELIKFLNDNNKSVLLTSYTHSAVDNILIKLKDDQSNIDVLRLGSLSKIHPVVAEYSPLTKEINNKHELEEVYLKPLIVATTCLSISDWVFTKRKFDYCIVDESSQVSMPICIGPLSFADKFILVGDHYQLPPLVKNPTAKGLSKSLFKSLSESQPQSVIELTKQYRMCNDIMLLSNTLIYDGRLEIGSAQVGNQKLKIPNISKLQDKLVDKQLPDELNWIKTVLNEDKKVLFLNHDFVGGCNETAKNENIVNVKEVELIYQIVQSLLYCGVKEESIGIMSFYRAQLKIFLGKFNENRGIEMLTADRFQGRDKDCVIISLVRSNDRNDPGSLLKEWRRVNVAITRAKSKLIIIGSKKTLKNLKTIDAFMKILDSRGWFYDLPLGADKYYNISSSLFDASNAEVLKKVRDSKLLETRLLAKDIAEEMGLGQ